MEAWLRPMDRSDLASVMALEEQIFPDPWPRPAFTGHLDTGDAGGLVAEIDGRIIGYACYHFDSGDAHLTNLAVAPEHRRKSVAMLMLGHILGLARQRACGLICLEVRSSNDQARRFYEAAGFRTFDRSPGYYDNPSEDALVMVRRVDDTRRGL